LIQGNNIKTKEPVQGESKSGKQKDTRAEEIPELVLEDANQQLLFIGEKLTPEKDRQGNGDGGCEDCTDKGEKPKFVVQFHSFRRSLT
jgi:hypothetical protein